MATVNNKTQMNYSDPYALLDDVPPPVRGDVTVMNNSLHTYDGSQWISNQPSRIDTVIHENSNVIIGDMKMSAQEFKVCMKMLRKMAMEEMPEEFI